MQSSFARSAHFYRHLILCSTGLVVGLALYNVLYFQQIVFGDLFIPSVVWLGFLGLGIASCYTSSYVWAYWRAPKVNLPIQAFLNRDIVSYLPVYLLLGTLFNHFGLPVGLFLTPALAGFLAMKLWSGFFSSRSVLWELPSTTGWALLKVAMAAFVLFFSFLGINRFLSFNAHGDFSIFAQQIWGFSHLKMLLVGGRGIQPFGGHFSPIFMMISPVYWLWEDPRVLIILQNLVLALGAIPVYLMAVDRLRSPAIGLTLGIAYLLYPALQHSAVGDFHESLLIATPILFAFMFLKRQNYSLFLLCCVLTAMCKEDATIPVGMLGAYAWWKEGKTRLGLGVMIGAAVWFVVSFGLIMPYYQGFQGWYMSFITGSAPGEVPTGLSVVSRIVGLFSTKSMIFLLQLLIPLAGIAVLAPLELLIGIPTLLELLLYTGPPFGLVGTIYTWHTVAVIPAFFIATIAGIDKLKIWSGQSGLFAGLAFIVLSSLSTNLVYGVLPYTPSHSYTNYQVTRHSEIGLSLLKQIPQEASVSATSQLSVHLANRTHLYAFPIPWESTQWIGPKDLFPSSVDYVVADTSGVAFKQISPDEQTAMLQLMRMICADPAYSTVAAEDGYVILKHNASP